MPLAASAGPAQFGHDHPDDDVQPAPTAIAAARPQRPMPRTHAAQDTPPRTGTNRPRNPMRCFNCNGWGHISQDCPSPMTAATRARRESPTKPPAPNRTGSAASRRPPDFQ
jgi:hypothetical protein